VAELPAPARRALEYLSPERREPQAILSILLDPEALQKLIMVAGFEAEVMFSTSRVAWLCPAGYITDMVVSIARGWNCVSGYVVISSNYYSPDIVVYVYADDNPVTPGGVALTGETRVSFGQYFVLRKSYRISVYNYTDTDVYVSKLTHDVLLTDRLLREFYMPLLRYAKERLVEMTKAMIPAWPTR
jgi:hypothetical protein